MDLVKQAIKEREGYRYPESPILVSFSHLPATLRNFFLNNRQVIPSLEFHFINSAISANFSEML